MIPGASSAPSQMIQFVPRIFPEQNSAVETYVTIAVVNPYGKNQEAAIQFFRILRDTSDRWKLLYL